MNGKRIIVHAVCLFLAPLVVAWFGLSIWAAAGLVLLLLLWRWMISLSVFSAPASYPEVELETIAASHFAEKARWCMDRLGIEYSERQVAGTLGAFFLGRTVPVLHFRTGAVRSSIGNSSEILRYLWGRYAHECGEDAEFLRCDEDRARLEKEIDRSGVSLQVWVYYHILDYPALTKHAWGVNSKAIPAWQRWLLNLLYPLQVFLIRKAFRISTANYEKSVAHIEKKLAACEALLADGRQSLLGGDDINYTDMAFAAIMGLWRQPPGYGGKAGRYVKVSDDEWPTKARADRERWLQDYPLCDAFIQRLYRERQSPAAATG